MTIGFKEQTLLRTTLANGITVIAVENPAADIISGRLFIQAGSRYEPDQHAGVLNLVSALLTRGTQRLSSLEIAEQVESVGASLGADATPDYSLLSFKTVSADFLDILALTAEILREPSFPASEVELEKRLTCQNLRSMQEQPFSIAYDNLRRIMYGSHPYARSGLGTEASITALTIADLQHYHRAYYRPDNLVISLVGRMVPEEAIAAVDRVFGDWAIPTEPLPIPALPTVAATTPQRVLTGQDTQQSVIMVGHPAAPVHHPDYPVLKLLSTYLGNGLSSRLFTELREKQGLAYEVSSFYPTRVDPSQFVVYMGTAPDNTEVALAGLCGEVARLAVTQLSEDELQAAKNKLLGQYALGKQTNSQIAHILGWYEMLGLGLDYDRGFQDDVAAITREQALAIAQSYFQAPYISALGPEAAMATIRG